MPAVSSHELAAHLWKAADMLRGEVETSSAVNCIAGLLVLKRLSDRFEEEVEELIAGGEGEVAGNDPDEHEFVVPEDARWGAIQAHTTQMGDVLNRACAMIADRNPTSREWANAIDFNDRRLLAGDASDRVLQRLVDHFSLLSMRNSALGDLSEVGLGCQAFLGRLADGEGKRGASFHIPDRLAELLVQLLDPQPGMRISDPACGAGGVLVRCGIHAARRSGQRLGVDTIDLTLHGQERNVGASVLCRINMVLAGLSDARIESGDTIHDPKLVRHGELMLYDRVITSPPIGPGDWGVERASQDRFGRFRYGLPPRHNGDYAFVQHALASLNSSGVAGIVVSPGVLFRGGSEAAIRAKLVDSDVIEAIIALPANLLHGTAIPVVVLVLNRNKPRSRRDKILFVDASLCFEACGKRNELRPADIDRIVAAMRAYRDEDRFCRVAAVAEVTANDHNLSVARYVDTLTSEAPIDVDEELVAARNIEATRDAAAARMDELLRLLGHGT